MMRIIRPRAVLALIVVCGMLASCGEKGAPERSNHPGTLRIAMTASDIPSLDTTLAGNQGYEGNRFVGNQLYDGLTRYDLDQSTSTPRVVPALAQSWELSPTGTEWIFHLRPGVTFTDGTPFDADAVIFNLDRYMNPAAPQFNTAASGRAALSLSGVRSYRRIDDRTVAIETKGVYSHLPEDMVFVYMASPAAVTRWGSEFGAHPVGTGPFVYSSMQRGQRLTLRANPHYWRGAPKLRELVLLPVPDASARLAAVRSGSVDWAEAPNPDDIDWLRGHGYQVLTNAYDHVWPWIFDVTKKPLDDVRVRRALNYAIDRRAIATHLLAGTADTAEQVAPRASLAYRPDDDLYGYDPEKARQLLAQAGYPRGFDMTVSYPTSGSGNMQPGSMNQAMQADLAAVGVRVRLKPIEWAAMLTAFSGGSIPDHADAINISLTFIQEAFWGLLFGTGSPTNIGHYSNPRVDDLITRSTATIDPATRNSLYGQISAQVTADAAWLTAFNDRNPRVLAPDVHGFVQPKSWFLDLVPVSVD
ncbi:ABC transporter substrate-binding protein [Tsukamurella sp. 8F]|uniref:ABC transporter substrate-binding protein n=1 Tax=unclassified Tsukamurella TaxID=2633480 RepID=UPI0023B8F1BD|nr:MULTISPECIES: ABC transporter substrate-binding protein [unclassified Tsukamurella]MDF0528963.1 ABC transporter substrate-binding protein [Tsukamurella sp. 8J]MDF0587336.1 ABC transporter substrate-binding protein [Tsukamurella sp. 8F]